MKFFLLFFVFFTFSSAISQNERIADSLAVILRKNDISKKERSKLLSLRAYHHQNIDTSRFLAKEALKISTEINEPFLQARAWEEIGHVERRLGNNTASLQASLRALQIFESLGLVERQAASYGQLASNFISDNDYKSAVFYLKKARRIYQNSDKFGNEILTILNLGEAYRLAGHLDSATTCFKETLRRNEILKNEIVQGYSMGNLGMVYSVKNELISAKINLNDAIDILSPLGDPYSTSIYLAELGSVYIKEGNDKVAERNILEAMNLAKKFGLKEQISDFASQLSNFYENKGLYSKALEYQRLNQVYKDSLVSKASIQKIEQLKSGYEISKRETEIDLLNTINTNQKNRVFILGAGVLLLLLFSYLLFRGKSIIQRANNELSLQKKIISDREQEKALLLKELNHRVKNNLQMISSLLSLQSRELKGHPAQEAIISGKNRVEALSLVHRKLYQEGLETRILIKEYIEELVLGLFHGYNADFEPILKIEDTSLTVNVAVPIALIVNEMVVNALKYAYSGVVDPFFEVKAQMKNDFLEIEIRDNGVGFSTEEGEKNNSFGLKLITSLIDQLDGTIEKLAEKGTNWRMRIKVI